MTLGNPSSSSSIQLKGISHSSFRIANTENSKGTFHFWAIGTGYNLNFFNAELLVIPGLACKPVCRCILLRFEPVRDLTSSETVERRNLIAGLLDLAIELINLMNLENSIIFKFNPVISSNIHLGVAQGKLNISFMFLFQD